MKFWMILAFYLLGVVSGILLWEKIDVKTIFKGTVKLRQRGRGNTQLTEIKPQIDAKTERVDKKQQRKDRRDERRSKTKADS